MRTVSHRSIQDASPVDFKLHHYPKRGSGLLWIYLGRSAHGPWDQIHILAVFAWASSREYAHWQGWRMRIIHFKLFTTTFTCHIFMHF